MSLIKKINDVEGILIHAETNKKEKWLTDRLPALNTSPKDVAGAGDSLLTCASMAMAVGADIWQSCYLGSLAAACQVGRLGNVPLSVDETRAATPASKTETSMATGKRHRDSTRSRFLVRQRH